MANPNYLNPVVEVKIYDKTEMDAMNVSITLDLDFSSDKASFDIDNNDGLALFKYFKWDGVEIWAGYDTPDEIVFRGMITTITPSMSGGNKVTFECQNMGALIMFYPAKQLSYSERNVRSLVERVLFWNEVPFNKTRRSLQPGSGNVTSYVESPVEGNTLMTTKINPNIPLHLTLKTENSDTIANVIAKIKEKTAYEVWIDTEGYIRIEPLSVMQKPNVTALSLTYGENLIDMGVGDLGQIYNRVEVYGLHPDTNYAFAEDKVLIAQMLGQRRTFIVRDRSVNDYKTCLKIAQEKLLQLVKNFKISAKTIFLPTLKQGDAVTLENPFMGIQGTFIIQTVTHTISGSSASTNMELFGGIVSRVPEKAVVNKVLSIATDDRRD